MHHNYILVRNNKVKVNIYNMWYVYGRVLMCAYLSCYVAGFNLLNDCSIYDVVYSIFWYTCPFYQAPI